MTITTAEVWSALPYSARRVLIPEDLADFVGDTVDLGTWTHDRIQVTPWFILPPLIQQAVHSLTTCDDIDASAEEDG